MLLKKNRIVMRPNGVVGEFANKYIKEKGYSFNRNLK
jgi:hypothetical protein